MSLHLAFFRKKTSLFCHNRKTLFANCSYQEKASTINLCIKMNKPQATGLTDPGFRYCHTFFVSTIYKYNVRAYIIFKLHNPSRKKHAVRAFLMAKTNVCLRPRGGEVLFAVKIMFLLCKRCLRCLRQYHTTVRRKEIRRHEQAVMLTGLQNKL